MRNETTGDDLFVSWFFKCWRFRFTRKGLRFYVFFIIVSNNRILNCYGSVDFKLRKIFSNGHSSWISQRMCDVQRFMLKVNKVILSIFFPWLTHWPKTLLESVLTESIKVLQSWRVDLGYIGRTYSNHFR